MGAGFRFECGRRAAGGGSVAAAAAVPGIIESSSLVPGIGI